MPRVHNPQPGYKYKVVCQDCKTPHKEVIFTFVNIAPGRGYEIEVNGVRKIVGDFCDLCRPWACEVHNI